MLLPGTGSAQSPNFQKLDDFGDETAPPPGSLEPLGSDIVTDVDGNVWALVRGRAVKYTFTGDFITEIRGLEEALGIGADDQGFIYVAERGNGGRVSKFDTNGTFAGRRFGEGVGDGDLAPNDVAVDSKGVVFVTDTNKGGRIARFAADGKFLGTFGKVGPGGLTGTPEKIAIASDNTVFTIDPSVSKVVRLSKSGAVLARFGGAPDFTGSLTGVAVDTNKFVYISYLGDGRVGRHTAAGNLVEAFGTAQELVAPNGVAADCRSNVYAIDTRNSTTGAGTFQGHIVKYGNPASPPPPCGPRRPLPGSGFEVRVDDVDVTQAIQYGGDYTAPRNPATGGFNAPPIYGGAGHHRSVGLSEGKTTIVRVYASLVSGPAGGLGNVPATLTGRRGSELLGELMPIGSPAVLRTGDGKMNNTRRADPAGAYTFVLPKSWSSGVIRLSAKVNPAGVACANPACFLRGLYPLTEIPFSKNAGVHVSPIELRGGGRSVRDDDRGGLPEFFSAARAMFPLDLEIPSRARAFLDVDDVLSLNAIITEKCTLLIFCSTERKEISREDRGQMLLAKVEKWGAENLPIGNAVPIGVIEAQANGRVRSGAHGGPFNRFRRPAGIAVVRRKIRTVAHELLHTLNIFHASPGCGGGALLKPVINPATAPEGSAVPWPTDERGRLAGNSGPGTTAIGIDPRAGSGRGRGPFRILAEGARGEPKELYDLMSYCPQEAEAEDTAAERLWWIGPHNWQRLVTFGRQGTPPPPPADPPKAAAAQAPATLSVRAMVLGDGTITITQVERPRTPGANATTTTGFVLRSLGAQNQALAIVPMTVSSIGDGEGFVLEGSVPAANVQSVLVGRSNGPFTRRVRSPNVPTVSVSTPANLKKTNVDIRWKAADKDKTDKLTTDIEYSRDGGKSFRTLAVDVPGSSISLPVGSLARSTKARIRVGVNDGFNEASATSGTFKAPGADPAPVILFPGKGATVRADGTLELQGEGYSSDGTRLGRRALSWELGGKSLGSGENVRARGLKAGKQKIVLTAKDGSRTGKASLTLKVTSVAPAFLKLGRPTRLSAKAKTVKLTIATNVAARLEAGGEKFDVDQKTRSIRVKIKPGSSALALKLKLRAGKKSTTATVGIPRS